MNAHALPHESPLTIERADAARSIFSTTGPASLVIRAGATITVPEGRFVFAEDRPVSFADPQPGADYGVRLNAMGDPVATAFDEALDLAGIVGGFRYASADNAAGTIGGSEGAAINPCSLWDIGFRPACPDPRGMALVDRDGRRFWADIDLLGVNHHAHGTSRHGDEIADGRNLPFKPDGKERTKRLDFVTAQEIYAHHGKQLLGAEEFFAAAFGVAERQSRDDEPQRCGELVDNALSFVSQAGLFDITGTMWQWGTDGHPTDPRPSIFGGRWFSGDNAGSRYADLGIWAGDSSGNISARGRSDHLTT